jgi:catechol 2,3-dioxygenase-like lactoylglutathione lyase family enzyme
MSTDIPNITAVHHVSLTVTNLEDSIDWYMKVFPAERVDYKFNHLYREETGYGILLVINPSGVIVALHHNTENQHEGFRESRTGLDHLSFLVENRAELEAWLSKLDHLGIPHTQIRDQREPFAYSTVVFRDPDNNQLEFLALG